MKFCKFNYRYVNNAEVTDDDIFEANQVTNGVVTNGTCNFRRCVLDGGDENGSCHLSPFAPHFLRH